VAINLTVFRAQVDGLIAANDDELSEIRRNRLIKSAVEKYGGDKPDHITADITGDAGNYYAITTGLASWVEKFSQVLSIQYPAPTVASDEAPVYLDPEDWDDDYWDGTTRYLYLPNHAPAATEAMRVRYSVPWLWAAATATTDIRQGDHGFSANDYIYYESDKWSAADEQRIATHQVSASTDPDKATIKELEVDIPTGDFFAVCNLAASMCSQAIATKYSRTSDSPISADSVDHLSRAQQWRDRASEFMDLYEDHIGIGKDDIQHAAGEFVDWDTSPGWPTSRDYLFHGKHTR
jgi:hypothetical protein